MQASQTPQAMLVSLSFKFGRQGGEDDNMTQELCSKHNASSSDVKGTKRTICKEAFDPLKKLMGEFRSAVARCTIPWDKGITLCKPVAITKVLAARDNYGPEFDRLKEQHLLENYDIWKAKTKEKLGTAYSEEEFPSREELQANVVWKMSIMALPTSEALRKINDIDETIMQKLIESNDERIQQGIRAGMVNAYTRLMTPLQHMVDVLTDDSPKIHESLVENVRKVVEEIPSLNLADDPALSQFANKVNTMLSTLKADDLRQNNKEFKVLRKKVAQEAAEILATFGTTGVRKFNN